MPIRAVLFDLGHTLVFEARKLEEKELYARIAESVRPLLQAWGVEEQMDAPALLRDLYGAIQAARRERLARGYEVDAPFITHSALAAYGVEVSVERAEAFWRATFLGFDALGWQLYPDTLDTLRRVRALGIRAGLVSNSPSSSEVHRPDLARMGITEELLAAFVFSADVKRAKPHPAPFHRALEALGVEPDSTVFVGDDLEADMRGAKALGMTTVWKLNGRHDVPPAPEADYTLHHLRELFTLGLLPEAAGATLQQESPTPQEDDNADRH